MIRYKLMKTASSDLAQDFESKIGKIDYKINNEEERRRQRFKGLTDNEYHHYYDDLYQKMQQDNEKLLTQSGELGMLKEDEEDQFSTIRNRSKWTI